MPQCVGYLSERTAARKLGHLHDEEGVWRGFMQLFLVLCAMTALGVIGPTKRLGGLERSRDDLAERDALRAQISPFRYAPASPSRSQQRPTRKSPGSEAGARLGFACHGGHRDDRTIMDARSLHNSAILKLYCCDIPNTEPSPVARGPAFALIVVELGLIAFAITT
jgi:hypothetical protein